MDAAGMLAEPIRSENMMSRLTRQMWPGNEATVSSKIGREFISKLQQPATIGGWTCIIPYNKNVGNKE